MRDTTTKLHETQNVHRKKLKETIPHGLCYSNLFENRIILTYSDYDEPLDVILFRFECLIQHYQWTKEENIQYSVCVLGAIILRKMIRFTEIYSVLSFNKKRKRILNEYQLIDAELPSPKRQKIELERTKLCEDCCEASNEFLTEIEVSEFLVDMEVSEILKKTWRDAADTISEGLSQAQICYSMLYVTFMIWQSNKMSVINTRMQKIVINATFRVFELSRFRYSVAIEANEVLWWDELLHKIGKYIQDYESHDAYQEAAKNYSCALIESKLDFYSQHMPLPLIQLLQTNILPAEDRLKLSVDILCYSQVPIYISKFLILGKENEKDEVRRGIIEKYRTILNNLFSGYNELPQSAILINKVVSHLPAVQDEFVEVAFRCIHENFQNLIDKKNLLEVILKCITACIEHKGRNGLRDCTSCAYHILNNLSLSTGNYFVTLILHSWKEICEFFDKFQTSNLLRIIKRKVKNDRDLIELNKASVFEHFAASSKCHHNVYCSGLQKQFFLSETEVQNMVDIVMKNAKNYKPAALLRFGKIEYKRLLTMESPTEESFGKVFDILRLGLNQIEQKHNDNTDLEQDETQYLCWYFSNLEQLCKKLNDTDKIQSLMQSFTVIVKDNESLMKSLYRGVENHESALAEVRRHLGNQLVHFYREKFDWHLRCSGYQYDKFMKNMMDAMEECERYVENGEKEFRAIVISFIRLNYGNRKKLIGLINRYFPIR